MNARKQMSKSPAPLSQHEAEQIDANWRATNYLAVGQIYLRDNPLLHSGAGSTGRRRTTCGVLSTVVHSTRFSASQEAGRHDKEFARRERNEAGQMRIFVAGASGITRRSCALADYRHDQILRAAREILTAAKILGARKAIPIHFGSLHRPPRYVEVERPLDAFRDHAAAHDLSFVSLIPGECVQL
jgi:hypothetical protein